MPVIVVFLSGDRLVECLHRLDVLRFAQLNRLIVREDFPVGGSVRQNLLLTKLLRHTAAVCAGIIDLDRLDVRDVWDALFIAQPAGHEDRRKCEGKYRHSHAERQAAQDGLEPAVEHRFQDHIGEDAPDRRPDQERGILALDEYCRL